MKSNQPLIPSISRLRPRKRTSPRDLGRAMMWGPLVVAGIVATVVASRRTRLRQWIVKMWSRTNRRWNADWSLDSFPGLRGALIGSSRQAIKDVLGPPLAAIVPSNPASSGRSEVWYYPLSDRTQSAMAIEFDGGRAQTVDLIQVPREA